MPGLNNQVDIEEDLPNDFSDGDRSVWPGSPYRRSDDSKYRSTLAKDWFDTQGLGVKGKPILTMDTLRPITFSTHRHCKESLCHLWPACHQTHGMVLGHSSAKAHLMLTRFQSLIQAITSQLCLVRNAQTGWLLYSKTSSTSGG